MLFDVVGYILPRGTGFVLFALVLDLLCHVMVCFLCYSICHVACDGGFVMLSYWRYSMESVIWLISFVSSPACFEVLFLLV